MNLRFTNSHQLLDVHCWIDLNLTIVKLIKLNSFDHPYTCSLVTSLKVQSSAFSKETPWDNILHIYKKEYSFIIMMLNQSKLSKIDHLKIYKFGYIFGCTYLFEL